VSLNSKLFLSLNLFFLFICFLVWYFGLFCFQSFRQVISFKRVFVRTSFPQKSSLPLAISLCAFCNAFFFMSLFRVASGDTHNLHQARSVLLFYLLFFLDSLFFQLKLNWHLNWNHLEIVSSPFLVNLVILEFYRACYLFSLGALSPSKTSHQVQNISLIFGTHLFFKGFF